MPAAASRSCVDQCCNLRDAAFLVPSKCWGPCLTDALWPSPPPGPPRGHKPGPSEPLTALQRARPFMAIFTNEFRQ